MTLAEYFQQCDSPMEHSPIGHLMLRILAKFPEMPFEQVRQKAKELMATAAGRTNFQIPQVLTDAEQLAKAEALRARFGRAESKAA